MNPYDKEVEPGDRLTFTDELALHLADLGVYHNFDSGDELVVLERDDERKFKVCIGDPNNAAWSTWVFLTIAEFARDFWLKQTELERENEGVSSPLPLKYWYKGYSSLTREQHEQISQVQDEGDDPELLWKRLTNTGNDTGN